MFCSHIQLVLKKFSSLLCFQHFKANGLFFLISSHTKIVFLFCFFLPQVMMGLSATVLSLPPGTRFGTRQILICSAGFESSGLVAKSQFWTR